MKLNILRVLMLLCFAPRWFVNARYRAISNARWRRVRDDEERYGLEVAVQLEERRSEKIRAARSSTS